MTLTKLFLAGNYFIIPGWGWENPVLRIHDILGWIRIRIRGSMPLTNGSGSFYFRHWPSRYQQKTNFFNTIFSAYDFLKLHLHHFSKIKIQKEKQNSGNQGYSYYFCMMIEGSGSGSWRPKNMWIRIRIRIRNTGKIANLFSSVPGEVLQICNGLNAV
jgi:hypothetical protein